MTQHAETAKRLLRDTFVIDTLGGAVVHPTPHVEEGTTYEEQVLASGWNAMNACLVSEPSYNATWEEVLTAIYENYLYFEMSPKVLHVESVADLDRGGISIPLVLRHDGGELRFISTATTFTTAVDVTVSELAIESFFPADEATAEVLRSRAG